MELYILDSLYRRIHVVDAYVSLIWTERWQEIGDFELQIKSTLENRTRLFEGVFLALSDSDRVMMVETIEDDLSDEDETILTVRGRSLEFVLENRVAKYSMSSVDPWYHTGSPIEIPRHIFNWIIGSTELAIAPALNANDTIPLLTQRYPNQNLDEVGDIEWMQEKPDTLYNEIRRACLPYDLGFRILRETDNSELFFEVYSGRDLTTQQTEHSPVIFSAKFDNLQDTTEFRSIQKHKNVVYVFTDSLSTVVGADDEAVASQGFLRRVLLHEVTVPADHTNPSQVQTKKGSEAIKNARPSYLFDGEVDPNATYEYGVDYELGDLVEMRTRDGVRVYNHVTEQIFVDDGSGQRTYPTLSINRFQPPFTWLSYNNNQQVWEDFTDEVWADF